MTLLPPLSPDPRRHRLPQSRLECLPQWHPRGAWPQAPVQGGGWGGTSGTCHPPRSGKEEAVQTAGTLDQAAEGKGPVNLVQLGIPLLNLMVSTI